MNRSLEEVLVKGIGKSDILALAKDAAIDEALFIELLKIIGTGENTPAMKSAWIIGTSAETHDATFSTKYASEILHLVTTKKNSGIVRELMKALIEADLNEENEGVFIDFCFKSVTANVDVAIKYTANRVIEKGLKKYPELKEEFLAILESQLYSNTEAWTRYTTKIITRLKKKESK